MYIAQDFGSVRIVHDGSPFDTAYDANVADLDKKMALYGKDSLEYKNLQAQKEGLEADYITKLGGFRTAELKLQKETNDAKAEKEKETNEKIAADREEFVKRQGESAEKEKKYFKDLQDTTEAVTSNMQESFRNLYFSIGNALSSIGNLFEQGSAAQKIFGVLSVAVNAATAIGDIIFLSDSGVRSLQRVIQEKSLPMRDISKNVRDELMTSVASETAANIKSVYYDRDAFYLLSLPITKSVYCFDMRTPLQDGSARATTWSSIEPKAFIVTNSKELYFGKPGYIGKYFGHTDNGTNYRFSYYTNYFDFEQPSIEKIMKQIGFVVIGGANQNIAVKWGFDYNENYFAVTKKLDNSVVYEYNIGEYNIAEFSNGIVLDKFKIQAGGTGSVMQIGLEAEINGNPISIQRIDIYIKQGKQI